MNKYVQWLSFTQRKHCLGTGQLTAVGSHEILKYRTYKIQTQELRVFEDWIPLALLFVDIFTGPHCGHQFLNSFPFQRATDPAFLFWDDTALHCSRRWESESDLGSGNDSGCTIWHAWPWIWGQWLLTVLDKGQGCDWIIQSRILKRDQKLHLLAYGQHVKAQTILVF